MLGLLLAGGGGGAALAWLLSLLWPPNIEQAGRAASAPRARTALKLRIVSVWWSPHCRVKARL
jgi:hypothetical protein